MMPKTQIYYQNLLAGYLIEGDLNYLSHYDFEYLENQNAKSICLTPPLSKDTYQSNILFPFFDGLIPEGWLLEIGEKHWKLNPRDRFELLINLCRDTIGAVSVYPLEDENYE